MADYHIKHTTRYTYASTVIDCINQLILYPINDAQQIIRQHQLKITGEPLVETFLDYFGNQIGMFSIVDPHIELDIVSTIDVTTHPVPVPADNENAAAQWQALEMECQQLPWLDFLQHETIEAQQELQQILDTVSNRALTPLVNAMQLSTYVFTHFEYKKGVTSVETNVDEILKLKAGVCQDFAHVLIVLLHKSGIPARYVSGYICPKNDELRGIGATHAWVEAYIPFYGWLGLDPTNNCLVSDRHVRIAIGKSFNDCTPIKGTYKGSSEHTLEVSVSIDNGHERTQEEKDAVPTFIYTTKNPSNSSNNSYQKFLEIQQQQQQQQ